MLLLLLQLGLFCLWAAYGVIPTIHWIQLHGGISSAVVRLLLPR